MSWYAWVFVILFAICIIALIVGVALLDDDIDPYNPL